MSETMSDHELVQMFRNAFYSAMAVRNGETKPTDAECLRWLTKVRFHAERLQAFEHLPALGELPYWRMWIDDLNI
jgi:hypothetical protein